MLSEGVVMKKVKTVKLPYQQKNMDKAIAEAKGVLPKSKDLNGFIKKVACLLFPAPGPN
jgi:hypothetical protein